MKNINVWKLLTFTFFLLFCLVFAYFILQSKANKFISVNETTGRHVYKTEKIQFSIDPKFSVDYRISDGLAVRSSLQKFTSIQISNPDNGTSMSILLNMDGIGGACPNYSKDYLLEPILLDGKSVNKAEFINKVTANKEWPLGDVYIVDGNNCPNVAGIQSNKNGSVTIKYNMNNMAVGSKEYDEAVKDFDEVVLSVKHFWK
jgi:hypothetical protein